MGRHPISWSDMANFQSVAGTRLSPWQVGIIEMLDDLYLSASPDEDHNEAE